MVWETPSIHNHAMVKVNIYFRAQQITLHTTETTKVSWNLFSSLNYLPLYMCWFCGTWVFKSRVQELESHWTHCKMKGKTQINWVSIERGKKEIKTWESRPSTGLNYLSLLRISNNKHVVPGCWSSWYWGPRSPNKIIVRFSGWTKGLMLLPIGYKTGGKFGFKSSFWKL